MNNETVTSDKVYDLIKGLQVHLGDAKNSLILASINIAELPEDEQECFTKTTMAIKEIIGDLVISDTILEKHLR